MCGECFGAMSLKDIGGFRLRNNGDEGQGGFGAAVHGGGARSLAASWSAHFAI